MIKVLFFDIDGMLVSFNIYEIFLFIFVVIVEVKVKGIKIFIVIGCLKVIINNFIVF